MAQILRRARVGRVLQPIELVALSHVAHGTSQESAAHTMGTSPRTYRRLLSEATHRLRATGPVHAACLAISAGLLVPNPIGLGFRVNPHSTAHAHDCMHAVAELQRLLNPHQEEPDV